MNREKIFQIIGQIDETYVSETARYMPDDASGFPERKFNMKPRRILTIALAAALILSLGAAAYAVFGIHSARQSELKEDFEIAENNAESYIEYDISDDSGTGLVLLSTVNDGQEQRVFVNISPVTKEEAACFPEDIRFFWMIDGTEIGGFAAPHLPADISVSGDEIRKAVLEYAYDEESETMTLHCYLGVDMLKKAMEELGTDSVPLSVQMTAGDDTEKSFGPVLFTMTEEHRRVYDFGHAVYHDSQSGKDMEIIGLELTPFSAVWKVHYEGDAAFHTPEADQDEYRDWSLLEDKVCIESRIFFSDGSEFSTGGALTCPYEDGTVNLNCGWAKAIDIDDVQKIVFDDLVLWEK